MENFIKDLLGTGAATNRKGHWANTWLMQRMDEILEDGGVLLEIVGEQRKKIVAMRGEFPRVAVPVPALPSLEGPEGWLAIGDEPLSVDLDGVVREARQLLCRPVARGQARCQRCSNRRGGIFLLANDYHEPTTATASQ